MQIPNRQRAVDQLVEQLGEICGDVSELAAGPPADTPELHEVRSAVHVASHAISRVTRERSPTRLPTVLAAWKAIAFARDLTVLARSAVLDARVKRTKAIERRELALMQRARAEASRSRAHAARLERWLARLDRGPSARRRDRPHSVISTTFTSSPTA
jgi:hypothetical protein